MRNMQCSKCQKKIPAARMRALPNTKTCVECSDVERNYVRTIISGKTTYSEWEVIKNKDTKEYLQKLDSKGRQGFGSMLYRASKSIPEPKASEMSKTPKRAMRPLPEYTQAKFENVLKDAMEWIDIDKNYAIKKIETACKEERISGVQRRRALEIIEVFKPTPKVVKKKVEQEPVDDEIMHAFRNWKM
tara:strand:+ start:290 stop:853 length:564 start_codon:yes stop_codon:yes gene_type:complete